MNSGVGQNVAGAELRRASKERDAEVDRQLSGETNRAVAVARRVRDRQIEQAERLEELTEKAIADLEAKAEAVPRRWRFWAGVRLPFMRFVRIQISIWHLGLVVHVDYQLIGTGE